MKLCFLYICSIAVIFFLVSCKSNEDETARKRATLDILIVQEFLPLISTELSVSKKLNDLSKSKKKLNQIIDATDKGISIFELYENGLFVVINKQYNYTITFSPHYEADVRWLCEIKGEKISKLPCDIFNKNAK